MNPTLYDKDYYLWLEQTVQLLQTGKFSALDLENLIEEIAYMARREKRALESNLIQLLMHLLKWKYQTNRRSNSWRGSIVEHRQRIRDSFEDSPSLKPYFAEIFDRCYQDAIDKAVAETGLEPDTFPVQCPFTAEQVLKPGYLPD